MLRVDSFENKIHLFRKRCWPANQRSAIQIMLGLRLLYYTVVANLQNRNFGIADPNLPKSAIISSTSFCVLFDIFTSIQNGSSCKNLLEFYTL